jgi:topoisomerase-4 subunit A
MESLFRTTELETRFGLNMNVLDAGGVPRVMTLGEVLRAFLDHRMVVLERRTRFRLNKIAERVEVLEGYVKAFLDLDEVIRIIREDDEPKPALMARFELTERQAEAILNLRLRNLRKLEEMELRKELKALKAERRDLNALLGDTGRRWDALADEVETVRSRFGDGPIGARRTVFAEALALDPAALDMPAERFPVTLVVSQLGWGRAVRGHLGADAEIKYKEGDGPRFRLHGQSTDRLLITADDGRCYLLPVEKLPSGRGLGEPLGMHLEFGDGAAILDVRVHRADGRLLFATRRAQGFVADEGQIAAQTRAGRQVVNLDAGDRVAAVAPAEGSHVAVLNQNRKLLILPLDDLPVMSRGKGVRLQKAAGTPLADVVCLDPTAGLTWTTGTRQRTESDLAFWIGRRGGVGRSVPRGFPQDGRIPRPPAPRTEAANGAPAVD